MPNDQQDIEFQLATYFPYMVRIFYRDVSQTVKDVYTTIFGLSVSEWRTMSVLNDFEPLSAKEIVSRSSMDKVNVSRSISSLQRRKYLERHIDPADRRRVLLRLTRQGKQVMIELIPLVQEIERDLLKGLSAVERETLVKLMRKVSLNAHAIQPPTSDAQMKKVGT
ncbi:MAG: winged helix-turn-helix transcriptional regulator [Magnetovibrio sp.]|nr:winged helix-turn-helix transcriptional regulator [Magnetovibrio sp.]